MVELTDTNLEAIANAVKNALAGSPDPATLLGSVSEVWVLIALIIPGFIAFRIILWTIKRKLDHGQFLTTIYALTISMGIFIPVALLNQFDSLDDIRAKSATPLIIAELFGFGALYGVIIGTILKRTYFLHEVAGSAWDQYHNEYIGYYVTVLAKEGETLVEYSGYLKRASKSTEKKHDLTLGNPYRRLQGNDNDWEKLRGEVYLSENIIQHIERLAPVND